VPVSVPVSVPAPGRRSGFRIAPLLPALAVLAVLVTGWSFFAPDDLFIHLRFARNLAAHGEWSFNPGVPVAGATSPPWVLALAVLHLAGLHDVVAAKLIATACAAALVVVVAVVVRREAGGSAAAAAALVVAAGHWLTLWTAGGMETPLVPLLLVAGWTCLSGRRPRPLAAGLLWGIATWTRPDAAPAAAVLVAFGLLERGRTARGRLLTGFAVAAASWPLISRVTLGSWLPVTAAAKGASGIDPGSLFAAVVRTSMVAASESLPLVALAVAAVVSDRHVRQRWRAWLPLAAAASTFPAGFAVNHALGGVEATGRYLTPWFVLASVAAVMACAGWWHGVRRRRLAVAAAVALAVAQSVALAWLHRSPVLRYHDYHRRSLVTAARWLAEHAQRTDLVFAGDIGVIGYVGDVRVLDPAGIVNPDAPRWAVAGRTWDEIRRRRPRFAIDPAWFPGFDPSRFGPHTSRVIFHHEHVGYRWRREPGTFTVTFRELDWGRDRPTAGRP
jgi:hypothetical protein